MRKFDTVAIHALIEQADETVVVIRNPSSNATTTVKRNDVLMINGYTGSQSYCTMNIKRQAAEVAGLI